MASYRALTGLAVLFPAVVNGAWSDGHADIDRPGRAFKELSLDAQAGPAACFDACQVRCTLCFCQGRGGSLLVCGTHQITSM